MNSYFLLTIGLTFSLVLNSQALAKIDSANEIDSSKNTVKIGSNSEQHINFYELIARNLLMKRAEDKSAFHGLFVTYMDL